MKTVSCFLIACGLMIAQDESPVRTLVAPLGIPCEPGQPLPLGPGFPIICPPVADQGALVFVKTTDDAPNAFRVKVRYTTADGEAKESEQLIARNRDTEWTALVSKIGRLKTPDLPGNTVDGVDVEQLADLPSATARKKETQRRGEDSKKSQK